MIFVLLFVQFFLNFSNLYISQIVMGWGGMTNHLTTCIYFLPHPALLQSIRTCPVWGMEQSFSNVFQLGEIFSGNSCFHLCTRAGDVQLNRRHALFIVVCIMLACVLSLQICRISHIFSWSSVNKIWLKKRACICILKTNKQNQKDTLNLVVSWSHDLFGHVSKLLSAVKDSYIIFLWVFYPTNEILPSV